MDPSRPWYHLTLPGTTDFPAFGGRPPKDPHTDMLQFYWARNEHLVAAVKNGRAALDTRWRGSYPGLCAVVRLVTHMVALEERMLGPRYDCFGLWPVCPNDVVARYP